MIFVSIVMGAEKVVDNDSICRNIKWRIFERRFNWLCKCCYLPLLVRGANTNTLIDGKAIKEVEELNKLKALKLIECNI